MRQYLRDNALHWLHKYRVDGLRFDATAYIRNIHGNNNDPANDLPDGWSLLQWINDEINASQPWKITIAEDLRNNEWITRDTGAGGAGFDAQWDSRVRSSRPRGRHHPGRCRTATWSRRARHPTTGTTATPSNA